MTAHQNRWLKITGLLFFIIGIIHFLLTVTIFVLEERDLLPIPLTRLSDATTNFGLFAILSVFVGLLGFRYHNRLSHAKLCWSMGAFALVIIAMLTGFDIHRLLRDEHAVPISFIAITTVHLILTFSFLISAFRNVKAFNKLADNESP